MLAFALSCQTRSWLAVRLAFPVALPMRLLVYSYHYRSGDGASDISMRRQRGVEGARGYLCQLRQRADVRSSDGAALLLRERMRVLGLLSTE